MSKTIRFVKGGALGASGKPLIWEISKEPALSEALYVFVPGVPVEVSDSDAAWLLDSANTGGREFEVVKDSPPPPPANAGTQSPPPPPSTDAPSGSDSQKLVQERALDAAPADKPKPGSPAGGR